MIVWFHKIIKLIFFSFYLVNLFILSDQIFCILFLNKNNLPMEEAQDTPE